MEIGVDIELEGYRESTPMYRRFNRYTVTVTIL